MRNNTVRKYEDEWEDEHVSPPPSPQQEEAAASEVIGRNKKKKKIKLNRFTVTAMVFAAIALSMIATIITQTVAINSKEKQRDSLKVELSELKDEEKPLEKEIEMLHDDDYLAELARTEYFLTAEGEIILILPNKDKDKEKK